jgi:hypothetical protein
MPSPRRPKNRRGGAPNRDALVDALDGHVIYHIFRALHELLHEDVVVALPKNGLRAEDFTEPLLALLQGLGNINTISTSTLAGLEDAPR